ncbi:hypothetical protein HZC27_01770 [Candidatus Roizmanbacteria bacterium]|nr:hypothetical protein [Candidatus Roizmanbacteria bacterium]
MKIKISSSWADLGIKDEIGLLSQIYGGFAYPVNVINIAHTDSEYARAFVESQECFCGIEKLSTIDKFVKYGALTITDEDRMNMSRPAWCLHDFTVSVDWTKLHNFAGFYHDFEAKEPYGSIQQEKIVRKIIIEKVQNSRSRELELSERDLGTFIAKPIDVEHYSYDDNPDLHIKFMTTLFQLEREKFIKILGLDFNFDANRKFFKTVSSDYNDINPIYDDYYYPAEHCHVEIELLDNKKENKQIDENNISGATKIISITKNWRLVEKEYKAYIYHGNKNLFTFSRMTSNTYLYFKHLCKNYGKKIAYEEMYKVGSEIKDRTNPKRWETNAGVRRTINKLKENFKNKKIRQIRINTKEYLVLTISS